MPEYLLAAMNILHIVFAIGGAILADASALESLIAKKDYAGLAENILALVGQVIGTFTAKLEARDKAEAADSLK